MRVESQEPAESAGQPDGDGLTDSEGPSSESGGVSGGTSGAAGDQGSSVEGSIEGSGATDGATETEGQLAEGAPAPGFEGSSADTGSAEDASSALEEGTVEQPKDDADDPRVELDKLAQEHEADLPDGTYLISAAESGTSVLASTSSSSALQARKWSTKQQWTVSHDEKGYVTLSSSDGDVLEVAGDAANARPVRLAPADAEGGSYAQKWIAVKDEVSDVICIVSALDQGYCLDRASGKYAAGTTVQLYSSNGSAAQKWTVADVAKVRAELDALDGQNIGGKLLPEGRYAIVAGNNWSRQMIDVYGGSKANAANVQLYASNGTDAQRWDVSYDEQGYATFTNAGSGKVLDVYGGSTVNGTNVHQYDGNGSWAQKWIVTGDARSGYRILSALWLDLSLDVRNGSIKSGSNLRVYAANGSVAQRFYFVNTVPAQVESTGDIVGQTGWVSLRPAHASGLAVDIASGSRSNGANAQLYASNGSLAQLFRFEYQKDSGYYVIRNAASGKLLDVTDGDVVPGANVQQWGTSAGRNSLFAAVKNDDGTFSFVSKATGLALDVYGASKASGANLDAFTPNGSAAQRFNLVPFTGNMIKTGLYKVFASAKSSAVLDVASGSTSSGANVQVYGFNGTAAQKWYIAPVSGKRDVYTLENAGSGKMLAADSNGNVCQRTRSSSTAQQWELLIDGGGMAFKNVKYSKVLDLRGGSTRNGANVQVYADNGTAAQRFRISGTSIAIANGTYTIRMAKKSSTVLDVRSGSSSNGANVQVYASNNSGAQKWNLKRYSNGTYSIINARSGRALDVYGGKAANGRNVQQYTSNGSAAQRWRIEYAGNGGYKFVSAINSSYVLDIYGGSTRNGANAQLYEDNGSAAQRFTFKKTTYVPENLTRAQLKMYKKAQGYSSSTRWLILADTRNECAVGVFEGSRGNWTLRKYWAAGPGRPSTPTVRGQFTVTGKGYVFGHGYSCYYYTQFYGDYLFHSIKYYQGTRRVMDGRLGQRVSAGCVRLAISNAKWLYDNIPYGTKVVTY